MHIQFSYKQVNAQDKVFLENYIDKKIERIKNLLDTEKFSNAILDIRVEKFVKKNACQVELHFSFPGGNFMASEDDHTIIEAFDLALDKLVMQLRRQHEKEKVK
ncbi:MAG TPA: HPF/RaiA family ribosome-associated protein [bacterium]|nr:HPF/RaiA family ribosome-associated protein [bacterium]